MNNSQLATKQTLSIPSESGLAIHTRKTGSGDIRPLNKREFMKDQEAQATDAGLPWDKDAKSRARKLYIGYHNRSLAAVKSMAIESIASDRVVPMAFGFNKVGALTGIKLQKPSTAAAQAIEKSRENYMRSKSPEFQAALERLEKEEAAKARADAKNTIEAATSPVSEAPSQSVPEAVAAGTAPAE